jgi:hypothetical protein
MTAIPAYVDMTSLYVDDAELHRRLNPKLGRDRFRAAIKALEAEGFPTIHKLMGGRYWPAVVAFFDHHHGLRDDVPVTLAQDGPEHFDAPAKQRTGPQERPNPQERNDPLVLDRPQRGAGHKGISGQVHSLAGRRG